MKFTERFNELMKEFGYDKKYLSNLINVTEYRIQNWIDGKSYPRISEFVKLRFIFNCSIDYMIGNSDNK